MTASTAETNHRACHSPGHAPTVSVAIATFNGERYIEAQLESILTQSMMPSEIILSDDGSTDDTVGLAERILCSSTVPYRILENRYERGYGCNFSTAFEEATGSIIFASDQDDFWLPHKIETVVGSMTTSGAELVVHDAIVAWDELHSRGLRVSEEMSLRNMDPSANFFGCMMAFRKELRDIVVPISDNAIGHDFLLDFFSRARGSRSYLQEALMLYRRHTSNVSTRAPVGELVRPSLSLRVRRAFDYDWLSKRRSLLQAALSRVDSAGDTRLVLPASEEQKLREELPIAALRARTVFAEDRLDLISRALQYRRLRISMPRLIKDLLARQLVADPTGRTGLPRY